MKNRLLPDYPFSKYIVTPPLISPRSILNFKEQYLQDQYFNKVYIEGVDKSPDQQTFRYFSSKSNKEDVDEELFQENIRKTIKLLCQPDRKEQEKLRLIKQQQGSYKEMARKIKIIEDGCNCTFAVCGFRKICEYCLFREEDLKHKREIPLIPTHLMRRVGIFPS